MQHWFDNTDRFSRHPKGRVDSKCPKKYVNLPPFLVGIQFARKLTHWDSIEVQVGLGDGLQEPSWSWCFIWICICLRHGNKIAESVSKYHAIETNAACTCIFTDLTRVVNCPISSINSDILPTLLTGSKHWGALRHRLLIFKAWSCLILSKAITISLCPWRYNVCALNVKLTYYQASRTNPNLFLH